jgi:RimJ/RimL family protein N-acetyltransferase
VKLIPIAEYPDAARILYQLLEERPDYANISHRRMPTWDEHMDHVSFNSTPFSFIRKGGKFLLSHRDWCLAVVDGVPVGAVYLSAMDELGPGILKAHQSKGYGEAACRAMMAKHGPRRYCWNVNPRNAASIALAEKLGFRTIQHTMALDAD